MDSKERCLLEAKINDAIKQCDSQNVPKFVGFLDASGAAVAVSSANRQGAKYMLFGGYISAERVYFGVFPDWCEPDGALFPLVRLKIHNKSGNEFTHRDILGALMSAGIERDTVGDIVVGDCDAVVFVAPSVAKHIKLHIVKIASAGVEIFEDTDTELEPSARFEENTGTIASRRLDCVVSEIANCSRGRAAELIEGGLVSVGGLEALKLTLEVKPLDVVSVRRVGKFIIDECDRLTKKGRIAIKYRKYI